MPVGESFFLDRAGFKRASSFKNKFISHKGNTPTTFGSVSCRGILNQPTGGEKEKKAFQGVWNKLCKTLKMINYKCAGVCEHFFLILYTSIT